MAFISKEVPSGVINGINTVFTLSQIPYQVDDCFLDGAVYLDALGVAGATLTFDFAPTTSIAVDYYTSTPPVPPPPTTPGDTLADLRAKVIAELRTVAGSRAYPTTLINNKLNEGYVAVFNQPKKNVYLREDSVEFMGIPDTQVNGNIVAGASTIPCDNAINFPGQGTILIGGDFVDYAGTSPTAFLGCTGLTTSWNTSPTIRATYRIPDYATYIDEQQIRAVSVDNRPFTYMPFNRFLDPTYYNRYNFYSIFDNKIILPMGIMPNKVFISFFKEISLMTMDNETPALIPNVYRQMLVYYATGLLLIQDDKRTGWELYYNYNPQQPAKSSGLYFEWLRNFYGKYGRRIDAADRLLYNSIWD